jgi:hypothetical protein
LNGASGGHPADDDGKRREVSLHLLKFLLEALGILGIRR